MWLASLAMLATLAKNLLERSFPFSTTFVQAPMHVGGGLVFDVVKVTVMILLPLVVGFASAFVAG